MSKRILAAVSCLAVMTLTAWFGNSGDAPANAWTEVAPGVLRTAGCPPATPWSTATAPCSSTPRRADGLQARGVKQGRGRPADAPPPRHLRRRRPLPGQAACRCGPRRRPPSGCTPSRVRKYWQESLPLRNSRTAYLVRAGRRRRHRLLAGGRPEDRLARLDDPASSPRRATRATTSPSPPARARTARCSLFCGDALAAPGKLWSPYTTDWDHWTDVGLKPAAESLRKLADAEAGRAAARPTAPSIDQGRRRGPDEDRRRRRGGRLPQELRALHQGAARQRRRSIASSPRSRPSRTARKPWSQVSEHLWLTGNTYVLISKDNACLVVDPWDQRSADQIAKLQEGPEARAARSRAVQPRPLRPLRRRLLPARPRQARRSGRSTASPMPIAEPFRLRAPFLDARPVQVRPTLEGRRDADLARVPLPLPPPARPDRVHDGRRDDHRRQEVLLHGRQLLPPGPVQRHAAAGWA